MAFKVGLELHVYLDATTKLFCNCPLRFDAEPNTTICPVCTAQPGSKPMLPPQDAVDKALQIALLLNCNVSETLLFQRKHYSWPDLPSGYQRTMSGDYGLPVGVNGKFSGIRIRECHLEEDPARWDPATGHVDYNRSGYPLMEIVTEPDFTDVVTLRAWLEELVLALSYIKAIHRTAGVKGDVNVSISPKYERVEIKNINSFSAVVEAVEAEVVRQQAEVSMGKSIPQQTRAWSDEQKQTLFMRSKESAADYRFIPEPDLPVIPVDHAYVEKLRALMPETPEQKRSALQKLGLSEADAIVLANDFGLISMYENVKDIDPAFAARWVRREVVRIANYHKKSVEELGLHVSDMRALLQAIHDKKITEQVGQKIMEAMGDHAIAQKKALDVESYIKSQGLGAVTDTGAIKKICAEVIAENPKVVEDYKSGNEKSLNFLVGQVMRKSRGAAKPDVLLAMFKELLG